jgi:gamma-glutamylcyclotransferase (GGCT)/AIG2-like uncharacterized protein YtfP
MEDQPMCQVSEQFPYLVCVYGTLKEGFYNYASVMQPLHEGGHFVKLHANASTNGFLFVDAYYVPYLVVDGDVSEDSTVTGEVYGVDQIMLDKLDILEGVDSNSDSNKDSDEDSDKSSGSGPGRYTRSEVTVTLNPIGDEEAKQVKAFIYHLKALPSVIRERGLQPMPCYDEAGHKEKYVPQGSRDQARYQAWGGYE